MLKNYFKIAVRNLWKKKVYSGINLLGLSIAAAFCMLVYMYVKQERSFDTFHKNSAQLYRLEATNLFNFSEEKEKKKSFFSFLELSNDETRNMLVHSYVLADDIKARFPEVLAVVRAQGSGNTILWYNNEGFKIDDQRSSYVEKNFFQVLDFALLKGNAATVLSAPGNVVITEKVAKRIFGNTDPMGKLVTIPSANNKSFTVAGIAKDFPTNSSIQLDVLMPLEAHPSHLENTVDRSNNHFNYTALLLLKKNTDAVQFQSKLDAFAKSYFAATIREWQETAPNKQAVKFNLYLRPFTESHYNSAYPWGHYTNLENLYQLAALALIILLIACVNYVLLTLTNTVSRSQEVGVRKTMGAKRTHIIYQFLAETQLLVVLSVFAGFFLCSLSIPLFNAVTDARIDFSLFSARDFLSAALALCVLLGIAAGFYPALVMSGMKPLNMLRRFSSVRISPVLSKALVVAQYSACLLLIITAIVISQQVKHMNSMDLGFDREQVIAIENPYDWSSPERSTLAPRLYNYAASDPAISNATMSNSRFGSGFNMNGHLINDKREMLFSIVVDFNYFDFMGIKLVKGRFFSKEMPTDSARFEIPAGQKLEGSSSVRKAVVVNETLYNLLGKPNVGELNRSLGARIIGVCQDYHFFNSTQKVAPAYHSVGSASGFNYAYFKIKPGQHLPAVMDKLRSNWNTITAKQPFVFSFMDEDVKRGYEAHTKWMKTINAAMVLAVIIACLGLFGLSALYAVNRTKEVGIRKVMGATVSGIFVLLNKDVFKLAIVSFAIAVPLAVYFMNQWLQNFSSRIKLSWVIFLAAGIIGLLLAVLAVSYHSLRAARTNPVNSLRNE
jgi:putative ABC transport system permease protein